MIDIPYVDLSQQHKKISPEIIASIEKVILSGKYILSDIVGEFEDGFAHLIGSQYAVGVNSGTDALILSLRALGIGPGDEVITAPNSYITTASSIVLVGAKPVFVDVGEDYTIDVNKIEAAITKNTKAIIPVHLTGRSCDMSKFMDVAEKHDVHVIEDAAQAIGTEFDGKHAGSFGVFGCFSLHPLKTLNACGDGGVIVTDDESLYQKLLKLRNNGMSDRATCEYWSANSRLDAIQASILLVKLKYLSAWINERINKANLYGKHLCDIDQIALPVTSVDRKNAYHIYVIQAERRDALKNYLKESGIKSSIHYPIPIHLQECAKELGYKKGDFPMVEKQADSILSLPMHSNIGEPEIKKISKVIRSFYAKEENS